MRQHQPPKRLLACASAVLLLCQLAGLPPDVYAQTSNNPEHDAFLTPQDLPAPGTTGTAALKGMKIKYRSTIDRELRLEANFLGTSVTVNCAATGGKAKRSFTGDLDENGPNEHIVGGEAPYLGGAKGGTVVYSFDCDGEWANTLWTPAGKPSQWVRWVRINQNEDSSPASATENAQ